jgi:hemerythrin-like metal-binding protein
LNTALAAEQECVPDVFVWSAKYETGIEIVDTQHHGLVDLINRIGTVHREAAPVSVLEQVLDELAAYARDHFATEHRLMHEAGLDQAYVSDHVATHGSFVKQLGLMRGFLQNSPQALLPGLLRYLITWLAEHILVEDQAMAWQVRSVADGMSAEAAKAWASGRANPGHDALVEAMHRMYAELAQRNVEIERTNARLLEREHQLERARRELATFNAGLGQRVAQRTAEVYEAQLRLQQEYDAQRSLAKQLDRTRRELEARAAGSLSDEFIDGMAKELDEIEQQVAGSTSEMRDPERALASIGRLRDAIATVRSFS